MSDIVPRRPAPAARRAPSFLALVVRIASLTTSAYQLKEALHALARQAEKDAKQVRADADHCAEAEVEGQFIALLEQSAQDLDNVAEAANGVAGAADTMEARARGFSSAHEAEYRGIYEAVRASKVRMPKPGFLRTR